MPRGKGLAAIVTLGCCLPVASAAQIPQFRDLTDAAGLSVVTYSGSIEKPHILESTGNGVLVVDYDGDGFQDLYFVAAYRLPRDDSAVDQRNVLYRNRGDGTFVEVTDQAGVGVSLYAHGGCVGDVDRDGWPDMYVTAYGPNILYRNNGDGTFTDITAAAGAEDPGWSIGCTFFDADGDGDHDLYIGNYIEATWEEILTAVRTRAWRGSVMVMDGPRGLAEAANTYYRNNGDGTFSEATRESGMTEGGMGYSMAVASFDYDLDGDLDVYVANDSTANRLYRNHGDGTFEEVATWAGCAYNADGNAQGSMGIGLGDYDGNGFFDLVVTNFAHDYYALFRNLDGELFQDDTFVGQLAVPSYVPLGWTAVLFDADHDRDLDLFLANGHIYPQVDEDPSLGEAYRQQNQLLRNVGGVFEDITEQAGEVFAVRESSRGAVAFDLENDGDLDLVVSNQDARPTLLENVTDRELHWLQVFPTYDGPSSEAIGTLVSLTLGGTSQIRQAVSGGGYASENDPRLHFGVAESVRIERVDLRWPDGFRQALLDLPADRIVVASRRP